MFTFSRYASLLLSLLTFCLLPAPPAGCQETAPVLKDGNCPSGYSTSGKYCVPGKNARFAITKKGNCPAGYTTSGKYCVAGPNAGLILSKEGTCPSGFTTSGQYCVKMK